MTSGDQSKYLASALATACDIANANDDMREIEQDFDAISVDIAEPWTDTSAV